MTPSTLQFILDHEQHDVAQLALQAPRYPDVDMAMALRQVNGRQRIRYKVPAWHTLPGILYPVQLSLEQCSSEATARYKAALCQGRTLVDLTGGLGVDMAFMAPRFEQAVYVERNEELCRLARHNFAVLQLPHIEVVQAIAQDYLQAMHPVSCIYLDPARRSAAGGRMVSLADCEPDAALLAPLLLGKARQVLVKLSPMLDLAVIQEQLPGLAQLHVVSVDNECKEVLALLQPGHAGSPVLHAVNITKQGSTQCFHFARQQEQDSPVHYVPQPLQYLYEPNASILKAGAFRTIAHHYGLAKLHPNSHLYTGDMLLADFPGRVFRVVRVMGTSKAELKRGLQGLRKANISVRNYPSTVADLQRKAQLADGGEVYLFATTLADERKVLLWCEKV